MNEIRKQLSVFLENRPGVLARVCSILSDAGINLLAIAIHDTVDNAVVRFLPDNPSKALLLLEREEFYVLEQNVLMIEIQNHAGELTRICQSLAEADINISYAYCTAKSDQDSCCLVIKAEDPERALEILTR